MSEFDNTGKAAAWKGKGGKAPVLTVKAYAHKDLAAGSEFQISLWRNDSDNEKAPYLTGNVQDPWKPQQETPEPRDDFDDEIPF